VNGGKNRVGSGDIAGEATTAILMWRGDEFSYEDNRPGARLLGLGTKSLIHRGRETLKEKLKPYLKTGCGRKRAHDCNFLHLRVWKGDSNEPD